MHKNKIPSWSNALNQNNFYEHENCEAILRGYAELGGLASGCDINVIFSKIMMAHRLLDVGSGYGRVIEKLVKINFSGELHALEKSNLLQKSLKKFENKITIHHSSILEVDINLKFDVILSMWSGISDFTPDEQVSFMQKLSSLLADSGKIIIDTSVWDQKPLNAVGMQSQSYLIQEDNCILHGYIPTNDEINHYANIAGLKVIEHFDYYTETKRRRLLYILTKNND